jgi:hypothetical protein
VKLRNNAMNTYNIRLPMIFTMMGLFLTVGMFAQTSQLQPIMTNATVEAMVRGGVPLETTIQAIKTAQQTDFTIDNKTRGQLTKAGASDSASAQILEAMHQRVIHSVTGSASSLEDKLYGGIRISGQTPSEGDQPRIDSTQMARPPVRVAVPTPIPVVSAPVLASTPTPASVPTPAVVSKSPPSSRQRPGNPKIPQAIKECEKWGSTETCSTWTWNGEGFDGRWPDGSVGQMKEPLFIADRVNISREDQVGTSAGLSATYNGYLNNGTVQNGTVISVLHGKSAIGDWTATFRYEGVERAPLRLLLFRPLSLFLNRSL